MQVVSDEEIFLAWLAHHGGGEYSVVLLQECIHFEYGKVVNLGIVAVVVTEWPFWAPLVGLDAAHQGQVGFGHQGQGTDWIVGHLEPRTEHQASE